MKYLPKNRSVFLFFFIFTLSLIVFAKPIFIKSIDIYQGYISPYKECHCAYRELMGFKSCSAYGKEVISKRGIIKGILLLKKRFNKCKNAAIILNNDKDKAEFSTVSASCCCCCSNSRSGKPGKGVRKRLKDTGKNLKDTLEEARRKYSP
jgi:putative component of membrane protein insertase Oxa1/YidC/SpoIIIJ protein YidD